MRLIKSFLLLFIIFISLISIGNVQATTCDEIYIPGVCIEVSFETYEGNSKNISDFKFPDLVRFNDLLVIEKILVVNHDEKNPEFKLVIPLWPMKETKPNLSGFAVYVPPLEPMDRLEIYFEDDMFFPVYMLNGQPLDYQFLAASGFQLYTSGDWIMSYNISSKVKPSEHPIVFFNGGWFSGEIPSYRFRVYSLEEIAAFEIQNASLESLKQARDFGKESINIGKKNLWVVIIIGLMTVAVGLFSIWHQRKVGNEQLQSMELQTVKMQEQVSEMKIQSKEQKEYELRKKKNQLDNLIFDLESNLKIADVLISRKLRFLDEGVIEDPMNTFFTGSLEHVLAEGIIENESINQRLISMLYLFKALNNSLESLVLQGITKEKLKIGMIDTIEKVEENFDTIKSIISEVKEYRNNV